MENLHLPIVRTHDTILMEDGVKTVDIHMIFANFRADENNPDNYWFKQTDEYLARAVKDGAKILFRLGESIEHGLVKYFVNPPKNVSLKAVDWNRQLAAAPFKVDGTAVTFQQQGNSAVFLLEFE